MRDIRPLNEPDGPPLVVLAEDDRSTLGPWEGRLARRQAATDRRRERVALRVLFGDCGQDQSVP